MMKWIALCATVAVSGCASTKVEGVPACPPSFKAWSKSFQVNIADGLGAMPANTNSAAVREAIRQMLNIRSELRAAGCKEVGEGS